MIPKQWMSARGREEEEATGRSGTGVNEGINKLCHFRDVIIEFGRLHRPFGWHRKITLANNC